MKVTFLQVTIGTPERGLEFAELTSYPAENLLADPENVTYNALSLKRVSAKRQSLASCCKITLKILLLVQKRS